MKKKLYTVTMAAMLSFAAITTSAFAEQASSVKVPSALSAAFGNEEGEISNYKEYDTGVNLNAQVTVVEPALVAKSNSMNNSKNNSLIQPLAEERRVYSHTTYSIGTLQIAGYSVGPINNQKFIVSVAKGHTNTASSSLTVTGTLQVSGSFNNNVLGLVKSSLNLSATGTVSKFYNTTDVWTGPSETSPYNTRDYYGAIDYDKYNINVVQRDYYNHYLGTTYIGQGYDTFNISVNNTLKPKNIEYSRDRNV
ncbi:hypothetical protein [Paenibacillus harenae]|uniref:hypothetical protein n=1 Tax=Paenibacillus harenae TaxID=306543 RepID=UPI0003FE7642|nr:hypothetical protein [Paenibacillus harenae]